MPRVLWTVPQVAAVGLSEDQAEDQGYEVETGEFPYAINGLAMALNHMAGSVKIVADAEYGEILGMHIVGAGATENIGEGVLAMQFGMHGPGTGQGPASPPHLLGNHCGCGPRRGVLGLVFAQGIKKMTTAQAVKSQPPRLQILDWGRVWIMARPLSGSSTCWRPGSKAGRRDSLILVEHPPVITLGRGGRGRTICFLAARGSPSGGFKLFDIDRGGKAHQPHAGPNWWPTP